ncbi:MAG: class D beta-lactamase [Rhodospirillales bacterium]|nr:class D beta-lactamase [Rhodospirillales bacterium]
MVKKTILVCALLFILPNVVRADDADIANLYAKYGITGALIITSLDGRVEYSYNEERLAQRYLPASTFKIPNTLIALEEGTVSGESAVIKWDGKDKGWVKWNKDQTLGSAFTLSCVWCYQEFAEKIGNDTYLKHLNALNYGNQKTGNNVTTFWLEGELKISAVEQIDFLRKVYLEQLPFDEKHIRLLKKLMIVEKTPAYLLRAKTGWAIRITKQHGWYVGYVEAKGKAWFFANNIEINSRQDSRFRKRLVMEALKVKGLI